MTDICYFFAVIMVIIGFITQGTEGALFALSAIQVLTIAEIIDLRKDVKNNAESTRHEGQQAEKTENRR